MSRSRHPKRYRRELHKPGGGYLPPGRFSKMTTARLARREPIPDVAEYVDPELDWLESFDEDDEERRLSQESFELIWSDGWIYQRDVWDDYAWDDRDDWDDFDTRVFGPRDTDDFEDERRADLIYGDWLSDAGDDWDDYP